MMIAILGRELMKEKHYFIHIVCDANHLFIVANIFGNILKHVSKWEFSCFLIGLRQREHVVILIIIG